MAREIIPKAIPEIQNTSWTIISSNILTKKIYSILFIAVPLVPILSACTWKVLKKKSIG